eukprot:4170884-Pyramimonas_sp.AAC.1
MRPENIEVPKRPGYDVMHAASELFAVPLPPRLRWVAGATGCYLYCMMHALHQYRCRSTLPDTDRPPAEQDSVPRYASPERVFVWRVRGE